MNDSAKMFLGSFAAIMSAAGVIGAIVLLMEQRHPFAALVVFAAGLAGGITVATRD